jgi:hypothetical protein
MDFSMSLFTKFVKVWIRNYQDCYLIRNLNDDLKIAY